MIVVPITCPLTIPVDPMLAMVGALLLHAPPPVASVSPIVVLTHNADGPLIAPGNRLMTIVALPAIVRVHPVAVIVATTL